MRQTPSPASGADPVRTALRLRAISPIGHFDRLHPLASVAKDRCARLGHVAIGATACGACWERVIRDDERFVVECGLPRELVADPLYVDPVAVERACSGDPVRLTRTELLAAVDVLAGRGLGCGRIARRLGRDFNTVMRCLQALGRWRAAA
jgi:hypothetical protein